MNVEELELKVDHQSGPAEFRIYIRAEIERTMAINMAHAEKLLEPRLREKFDEELTKETRPYRWQMKPIFLTERSVATELFIVMLKARGEYTDLTSLEEGTTVAPS